MDIALIAVAALSTYLAKGVESFAKKAGEMAAEKVGELYQAIKTKFKGDAEAEQMLDLVEKNPNSEGLQIALKEVLAKKMAEDLTFAEIMGRLVMEAEASDKGNVIASGEGSIAIGRDVKNSTMIIGDSNVVGGRGSSSNRN